MYLPFCSSPGDPEAHYVAQLAIVSLLWLWLSILGAEIPGLKGSLA